MVWIARVFGLIVIVVGIQWVLSREIEVEIEGFKPFFVIKGGMAVFLGIIVTLIGANILWDPNI